MYTLIGVDIAKDSYLLAHEDPDQPDLAFKRWPLVKLDLKLPDWWQRLNNLVAPHALVVAEPTGWHYLQPLATALKTWPPSAELWLITHQAAAQLRQAHIAGQKTDALDARTLAMVAHLISTNNAPRHVRRYNHDLEEQVTVLRLYVNTRARLVKQANRLLNQLDAFGHAIWPELNYRKATWHGLIEQGVITPVAIKAYAADLHPSHELSGKAIHYIKALARDLPDIEPPTVAILSIKRLHDQLRQLTHEQNQVEGVMHGIIHSHPFADVSQRWETMPMPSPEAIAALHVATHGQADQITDDEFKACLGAFPHLEHSGKVQKSRASKQGYRPAMNALHMWAVRLVSQYAPDNPIRRYHQKKGDFPATKAKLARLLSGVARHPDGYHFDPPVEKGTTHDQPED